MQPTSLAFSWAGHKDSWFFHVTKKFKNSIFKLNWIIIFFYIFSNATGNYSVTYINQTKKINVGGILIEYEGEDSGIGLLFASKAAIQVGITSFIEKEFQSQT